MSCNANSININYAKTQIKQILNDQFVQEWHQTLEESSKCSLYMLFKTDLVFEDYLTKSPSINANNICKFKTSKHSLPIEKGRYQQLERSKRLCELCDMNTIVDEYHYVCECKNQDIRDLRDKYLLPYYKNRPSMLKFISAMSKISLNKKPCNKNPINFVLLTYFWGLLWLKNCIKNSISANTWPFKTKLSQFISLTKMLSNFENV